MGWLNSIGSGLGKLFGGAKNFGSGLMNSGGQAAQSAQTVIPAAQKAGGAGFGGTLGRGINSLFTGGGGLGNAARGLGMMGLGSMVKNPQAPAMPGAFDKYMEMAGQGGPPINQSANQYMSSILAGQNTAAMDAATRSLDQTYEQRKRELIQMYKSLRPGTDPTSDSTFQRDMNLLETNYAQERADTLSRQQQGAAQYGMQAGAQQMNQQAQGVEALVNQVATQWNMDYNQKSQLRQAMMDMGGNMMGGDQNALLKKLFPQLAGG